MPTLMEEIECITCGKQGPDIHLCNPTVQEQINTCSYCGEEDVSPRHMCKVKVEHLTHICRNCGRVSDIPDNLCYPIEINAGQKIRWMAIKPLGNDLETCQNCGQPAKPPGHICDPTLPFNCKYCGQSVAKSHHMCKEIIEQAKFTCKLCGRIAVDENELCTAWELR